MPEGETCQPHFEVCSFCRGRGTSVAYLGAYTESLRDEMGEEWYEFMDDLRAGMYDRPCPRCEGLRVEAVHADDCEDERERRQWAAEAAAERGW